MKMRGDHTRILLRAAALISVVVAIAVFGWIFVGCSDAVGISFDRERITLYVGETRDIMPYVRFSPRTFGDKNISVYVEGECLSVDGSVVRATSSGDGKVTVSAGDATAVIAVTVVYRAPQNFGIKVDGELYQTAVNKSDIKQVVFSAMTDDFADPELDTEWRVNGVVVAVDTSRVLEFLPSGYGEFTVSASAAELYAEQTVRIYKPTDTDVTCYGSLEQSGHFSEVRYTAVQSIDPDNPKSVYEWRVNDEAVCDSPAFSFIPPAAGVYEISLTVNGANVNIDADKKKITAVGENTLDCRVVFDDADGVYIEWQSGTVSRIAVVSPSGVRTDVNRSDSQYSYLFDGNKFDASELIDICSATPGEYIITVVAERRFVFSFLQYPLDAAKYIEDKPFCKNLFVSDVDDGCELIDDVYASGIRSFTCYIGRDGFGASDAMADYARLLGLTPSISVIGNVCTVSFDAYDNVPKKYDALPDVMRMYTELPHIEYDAAKRRPASYVFASDRIKNKIAVENSEQLVTAVMRGLCPDPVHGSAADGIYTSVRTRLSSIIGADYSDAQKVHAIYDWLQWVTIRTAVADPDSASNYAESVFGTSVLAGGDARRAAITSIGMAKAFALMCGVEGIECLIQAENSNGALYMSNKVMIDGLWYNADAFGGRATAAELSLPRNVELCTHRRLLANDVTATNTGLSVAGGEYTAFDAELYTYYDKAVDTDGVCYDRYISVADVSDYSAVKAVVFGVFSRCALGVVSVPVIAGIETYMNTTLGVELIVDEKFSGNDYKTLNELLLRAANEYARSVFGKEFSQNSVRIYRIGNNIHLVASTAGMSVDL